MTSGIRRVKTYLKSSGVKLNVAQSCLNSIMSNTSPCMTRQHEVAWLKFEDDEHTLEVDFSVKVSIVEDLHRNFLLSTIVDFELGVLDDNVFLDILAWKLDFFVLAFTVCTHDRPISYGDRNTENNDEEPVGFEPTVPDDGQPFFEEVGYPQNETYEGRVAERAIPLGKTEKRGILYGWIICGIYGRHCQRL